MSILRKAFLLCVLATLALATVPVSVATAPAAAFTNLATVNCSANQDFCTGYLAGELQPIPLPNSSYPDWWSYIAAVRATEMPRVVNNFVSNYNVGYDSAMENAAAWEWQNAPTSCHNVAC